MTLGILSATEPTDSLLKVDHKDYPLNVIVIGIIIITSHLIVWLDVR